MESQTSKVAKVFVEVRTRGITQGKCAVPWRTVPTKKVEEGQGMPRPPMQLCCSPSPDDFHLPELSRERGETRSCSPNLGIMEILSRPIIACGLSEAEPQDHANG